VHIIDESPRKIKHEMSVSLHLWLLTQYHSSNIDDMMASSCTNFGWEQELAESHEIHRNLQNTTYHTVDAQQKEHKEKHERPELRDRQQGNGLRIRDEGQSSSSSGHRFHGYARFFFKLMTV